VGGTVSFTFINSESGEESGTEFELEGFTEMGRDLIRKKIRDQVQAKTSEILREVLFGLN
jgi:hypothetical protein